MTLRRKRRRLAPSDDEGEAGLEQLLELAGSCQRIVVFSGSGLSASSGMSTFSTRGGLYERAQRKYKLADGKSLFTYAFFDRQRPEAQAFFADIYSEAVAAEPAAGHHALRQLHDAGRLLRHYTLNIDGLAEQVGMDTWHHERNTSGVTVEMHGNVRHLVCPECHATRPMTAALAKQIRAKVAVPCGAAGCSHDAMRFKVMMYDDGEAECITPDDVMELMEEDVKAADLVLWVGISFQQSASTVYFRKVRCWMQEAGRLGVAVQALINPSDEALFNLRTAMSNQHELRVLEVLAESDEVLPLLADRLRRTRAAGSGSRAAAAARQQAAAAAAAANGVKEEDGWQGESMQQQQGAPPAAQHPQHLQEVQHEAGPAVAALLQQAVGLPGGADQAGWQQPQVTVQQLELLQAALTKAMLKEGPCFMNM
ncbi:DHS-like NAD FAD-binding domain-containing [Chlorella sorokiniana]|uniref:DHS-like NAD FAD-binding domain-containing n=1 Tax=Chlorella sorokiniana TaxID=3076 RepID=A0A2P6TFX7_CHLSO|nr:DHS-like NAD FAD-binding domain-containing [Chlorella sorokiniana]|eukprot:PRW33021.1 DHS-like NAD FAD-binding domain-containing [Chlorella sorokiniana]